MIPVTGILLAAGRAERFGGAKLIAPMPTASGEGIVLGIAAWRNLLAAIEDAIVVVRPEDRALAARFDAERARIVIAERADEGMGASLAAGVAASRADTGIVVALADMPWIEPATIARIAAAIASGASIAAPRHRGQRGHPVGFAPAHRPALLALTGDEGARSILRAHADAMALIDVDDPGVLRDVDTPHDLG